MEIPPDQLNKETLRALIAEFVTRDGTDYGLVEASEHDKIAEVEAQLRAGKVAIVFDAESQTCNLVPRGI